VVTFKDLTKTFGPDLETWDEEEEDRLEKIILYVLNMGVMAWLEVMMS
jgi:hypothetical protein